MSTKKSSDSIHTDYLGPALALRSIRITKYDPSKPRPITASPMGNIDIIKFSKKLIELLGSKLTAHPEVFTACMDHTAMAELLTAHSKATGVFVAPKRITEIPEFFRDLSLNVDVSHNGKDTKFFLTNPGDMVSPVSGSLYVKVMGLKEPDAVAEARKVIPEYRPRSPLGVTEEKYFNGDVIPVLNTYVPPAWLTHKTYTMGHLPALFEKLVHHLFPLEIEREYFYSWLYHSLFDRSYVYLILCGRPGSGKNRLKLVLRALHGFTNTVDGKKSTLVERFNSQLADATLAWFDELHYNLEMENVMKELQNDTISIERKGIDATRATRIYSSLIISNNKPRDNYIAFDARKFCPLVISADRLETSMTEAEIGKLTRKVENWSSPDFDLDFVTRIGKWIRRYGKSDKWPNLEYRGPMFYKLAHTSMTNWQKDYVTFLLSASRNPKHEPQYKPGKGFKWSILADMIKSKLGKRATNMDAISYSTVCSFFEIFLDADGVKPFATEMIPGLLGDFWVDIKTDKVHIITESELAVELKGDDQDASYYL